MLRVVQLNVLAPLWVGEIYKQFPCYDSIVSPKRMNTLTKYLLSLNADIYILCEVDTTVLPCIRSMFSGYDIVFTSNRQGFWSEHLDGKEWIKNGTCVLTRRGVIEVARSSHVDLGDGCMATSVRGRYMGRSIRVVSLHFDTGPRKYLEADVMLHALRKLPKVDVCIVSGDFNMVSVDEFIEDGYIQGGMLSREHTTILHEGVIDHTLVRGAKRMRSKVLHGPSIRGKSVAEGIAARMCTSPSGSDHYATVTEIIV